MSEFPGLRVLLAEDDMLNQRVIQMLLQKIGCQVEIAKDGNEAIEAFAAGKYDLIIMDYEMPYLNGPDAARTIRSREATTGTAKQVPIIAMTGHTESDQLTACKDAGMNAFLTKPLSAETLRQTLRKFF